MDKSESKDNDSTSKDAKKYRLLIGINLIKTLTYSLTI